MRANTFDHVTFSLAIILLILVLCTFAIEFQDFPNNYIVAKVHYLGVVGSVFLFYSAFYLLCFESKLAFDVIDILLVVLGLYLLLNYLAKKLHVTENISSLVLAIFCILGIKQLILTRNGYWLKNVCLVAIPLFGIYEVAYGQLQILGYLKSNHGLFAITGSFHNPGPFGIYLSSILVFNVAVWLLPLQIRSSAGVSKTVPLFMQVIHGISCVLIIMVLPATQSRTAWMSAAAGILFILVIKYKKALQAKWRASLGNIKLLMVVTIATVLIISLLLLYNFKPDSVDGRRVVWKITLEAIQMNPLFGIGFDQFRFQYGNFQSQYLENHFGTNLPDFNSEYVAYVFNDYLQLLAENGLVGLGIFLSLIYVCFRHLSEALRVNEAIVIGSFGGMLTILIAAFSSYPFELTPIWFLFLLFVGFASTSSPKLWSFNIVKNVYTKSILGIFLILCAFIFVKEVDLWKGRVLWGKAKMLYGAGLYKEAVDIYKLTIKKLGNRPDILPDYGKALFMAKNYPESARILKAASDLMADPVVLVNLGESYKALKDFDTAERSYKKAIKITPDRMYPRYLLAEMYLSKGDTLMAKSTAKFIINMPVQVPSSATRDMLEKMEYIGNL